MSDLSATVNTLTSILNSALSGLAGTPNLAEFNVIAGLFLLGGMLAIQAGTIISQIPIIDTILSVIGFSNFGRSLVFLGNIFKVIGSLLSGNVVGAVNSLLSTVGSIDGALPTVQFLVNLLKPLGVLLGLLGALLNKPIISMIIDKILPLLGPIGTGLLTLIKLLPTLATVLTTLGNLLGTRTGIGGVIFPLLNSLMPVLQGILGQQG